MVTILDRFGRRRQAMVEVSRLIAEADLANRNQDWSLAADLYGQALAIDPSRAAIHVQHGHALKEQGYIERAVQAYRKAIALKRRNADTHLQLGHALKLQGRMSEAAAAYAQARAIDPSSADIEREYAETAPYRTLGPRSAGDRGGRGAAPDPALLRILDEFDLGRPLAEMFDHQFYFFSHPELAAAGAGADPAPCLRHFCEHGLPRLSPIAPGCAFDPAFYVATYGAGRAMDPLAAYRHWLTLGIARGWAPNRSRLARMLFGPGVPDALPDGLLRLGREAEAGWSWTALCDRLLDGQAQDPAAAATLRTTLESLADRLGRGDERSRRTGFELVQRLMRHDPSPRVRLAHADGLAERGCLFEAARAYRRELDGGAGTAKLLLDLSRCLDDLGQGPEALEAAVQGRRLVPGDPRLRAQVDALAERLVARRWAAALEATGSTVEPAGAHLAQALATVGAALQPREHLPLRPIRRVALVGNRDLDQCRFYRIDQKLEQLAKGGFEAEFFDHATGLADFHSRMQAFDTVLFYRVAGFPPMLQAIGRARELGLATFYEIDDLIFDPTHYPPSLDSYDGLIDEREHVGLAMGVPLFAAAMRLCAFGLASTPTLAAAMAPFVSSNRVFVHRNAFGSLHERFARQPVQRPAGDKVTFFYGTGTKAHKEDFRRLVEPALQALVQRYGARVAIVLVGPLTLSDTLRSIEGNLVSLDAMPIEAFWEVLRTVDVNLAVLLHSVMADAKSEIKWMEAAMVGVPTVASDTATFREVIEPGVTGFLCGSTQDWTETLDRLFNDAALRRAVGERARGIVLERYSLEAAAANLATVFAQVAPPPAPGRRRRVVVVNVFYPPTAIGGATRVVHDNLRQITEQYGDVVDLEVFTSVEGAGEAYQTSAYAWDGVRVTAVTVPDRPDIESVVDDPAMGAVFERFLASARPDLIHFHCIQRLTVAIVDAARRLGIPYLITAHDGWWISSQQFLVNDALRIERYAFDNAQRTLRELGPAAHARMEAVRPALFGAARVLGVSTRFTELYRSCGVPDTLAIPNGVSAGIARQPRAGGPGPVRLGFIGGLERHKGSLLVRVALEGARFEHLSLLIVDHAMQPGDHRRERWGGVTVDVVPKRPQGEVAGLYAEIDVLLAPSLWPESYGLVTREALQAGCWVVASDRGSVGEDVIEGVNGFVVDVATVLPLRDVLTRIDRDPARFKAPPAPAAALRTSADQAADLARLYRSLLDPPA